MKVHNYNTLLPEIKKEVASYLFGRNLHFFSLTNKENLKIAMQELQKRIKPPVIKLAIVPSCGASMILIDNEVFTCGPNRWGEPGPRTDNNDYKSNAYTRVSDIEGEILQIGGGTLNLFVLSTNGLYIYGQNCFDFKDQYLKSYKVGNRIFKYIFVPALNLPQKIEQIFLGSAHILLLAEGKLFVFGRNTNGQLGLGDNTDRYEFTPVVNLPGEILEVSVGSHHNVVRTCSGVFVCGSNEHNQLGLEDNEDRYEFTQVENISDEILKVKAGFDVTYIITATELLTCGDNIFLHTKAPGAYKRKNQDDNFGFISIEMKHSTYDIQQLIITYDTTIMKINDELYSDGSNGSHYIFNPINSKNLSGKILQITNAYPEVVRILTTHGLFSCKKLNQSRSTQPHLIKVTEGIPIKLQQFFSVNRMIDNCRKIQNQSHELDKVNYVSPHP